MMLAHHSGQYYISFYTTHIGEDLLSPHKPGAMCNKV